MSARPDLCGGYRASGIPTAINISKYAGPVKVFVVVNFMILRTLFTAAQVHCAPSTGYSLDSSRAFEYSNH